MTKSFFEDPSFRSWALGNIPLGRLGTIEEGKIANLIVTNGDPLEIRTETKFLFINGRLTSTDNKHLRLYEKYRARPSSGE